MISRVLHMQQLTSSKNSKWIAWTGMFKCFSLKNLIISIFINNPRGDKYSVIWCLYDPGKKRTPGDIPPGVVCFPQGKQTTPFDSNYE